MGAGSRILKYPPAVGQARGLSAGILAAAILLHTAAACAPNPRKTFDASCGNDLECMSWYALDLCNDGMEVVFSFYPRGQAQSEWGPYHTVNLGEYVNGLLKCQTGQTICMGAQSGDRRWGLAPGGEGSCADCCGVCNGMAFKFYFSCGPAGDASQAG